jgi:peptidoglycan/xylan/chitin deacetylase (PgdA/CDA1 family)
MYHGVSPRSFTPNAFADQLDCIASHFDTYWVSELPDLIEKMDGLRRPAIVLTFDDGLRNNQIYATPLLERYRIKATFYLVSDLLDGCSMLWNHELRCRLAMIDNADLPLSIGPFSSSSEMRWQEIRTFVESVKRWNNDQRLALLRTLRERLPSPRYVDWMREEYEIMGAVDARGLPELIEIGSHTRTHPMLDRLSLDDAVKEIAGSRQRLESELGRPVQTFCYPNGQFSEKIVDIVRRSYAAAVTVEQGLVRKGDPLHRLKRIIAGSNLDEFIYYLSRPPTLTDRM